MKLPDFIANLSIRNKLGLSALAISGSVMLLASVMLISNEFYSLKKNIQTDLLTLADIIGTNASVGLVFSNQQASKDTLSSLKANRNITKAAVYDIDSRLFADYLRTDAKTVFETHSTLQEFQTADNSDNMSTFYLTGKTVMFRWEHVDILKRIVLQGETLGTVYIQAELRELHNRLYWYAAVLAIVTVLSVLLTFPLAAALQKIITKPLYRLLDTVKHVYKKGDYSIRAKKEGNDEIGTLIDGVNDMLMHIEQRDWEIINLNQRLDKENRRMCAELDVTKRLQQMILPAEHELQGITGLEISGFMKPADEVGGDYYDVLPCDGGIKIGLGDVTGHGLESGVVMLMAQTAVRALSLAGINNPEHFIDIVNRTLFANVQRMQADKNMTMVMLDYQSNGIVSITGQHENVLLMRENGEMEIIDTLELGFALGVKENIRTFIKHKELRLKPGDGLVLYTDGITEAGDPDVECYGEERLCEVVKKNWHLSVDKIRECIVSDVSEFLRINKFTVFDDIALLILKQKPDEEFN